MIPPDPTGNGATPPDEAPPATPAAAGPPELDEPAETPDADPGPPTSATPTRPGASTFTIEGRAAPGLFVVGWVTAILGVGLIVVGSTLGGPTVGGAVLLLAGLVLLSVGLVAGAGSQTIERRARGAPYAGPSPLLVFAAIYTAATVVFALVGVLLEAVNVPASAPFASFLGLVLQVVTYIGMIQLLVVNTGALSWREMGVFRPDGESVRDLLWGALYAAPVVLVTLVVASLLLTIFRTIPEGPLPLTSEPSGILLNFLSAVLLAPIGEEILFRGFATTAWARGAGERAGLVWGSILFAVAHIITTRGESFAEALGKAAVGFGTRVPVAVALGWIFLRRRSIYPAIGMHMAFNAILLLAGQLAGPPA